MHHKMKTMECLLKAVYNNDRGGRALCASAKFKTRSVRQLPIRENLKTSHHTVYHLGQNVDYTKLINTDIAWYTVMYKSKLQNSFKEICELLDTTTELL